MQSSDADGDAERRVRAWHDSVEAARRCAARADATSTRAARAIERANAVLERLRRARSGPRRPVR